MNDGLYQRLGGATAVAAIIDDAVDRHAANPTLAALFQRRDLPQLKVCGVRSLTAGTGGPGGSLRPDDIRQHLGMIFSAAQWRAVLADMTEALHEAGIGVIEVDEVLSLFESLGPVRNDSRTGRT